MSDDYFEDEFELDEERQQDLAAAPGLQPLHDIFLELSTYWDQFARDHRKGVVEKDVNAARRRARVVSIEIAKLLKEYRSLSNDISKQR